MEKTGEMNLYLYVDGRGRMTIPSALRCRTGMARQIETFCALYEQDPRQEMCGMEY